MCTVCCIVASSIAPRSCSICTDRTLPPRLLPIEYLCLTQNDLSFSRCIISRIFFSDSSLLFFLAQLRQLFKCCFLYLLPNFYSTCISLCILSASCVSPECALFAASWLHLLLLDLVRSVKIAHLRPGSCPLST